jgi:apolipoprotein N-acyltransferase
MPPAQRWLWILLGEPALFTVLEALLPRIIPWNISHSLGYFPKSIQIAEITGCSYLSFVLIQTGNAIYLSLFDRSFRSRLTPLWVCGVFWLPSFAFSIYRFHFPLYEGKELSIGIVQPGRFAEPQVPVYISHILPAARDLDWLLKLSRETVEQKAQLVLWPESALALDLRSSPRLSEKIHRFVDEAKTPLILGSLALRKNSSRPSNSALLFQPGTTATPSYEKNILFPLGEYLPFEDSYPVLRKWFPWASNYRAGTHPEPLESLGLRLAVTICYEDLQAEYVRSLAQEGAQAVINLSNDSWFGGNERSMHSLLARFRSVETRLPLARVSMTGVSYLTDQNGETLGQLDADQRGVLVKKVLVPTQPVFTIWTRYGDWFAWLCGIVSTACAIVLLPLPFFSMSSPGVVLRRKIRAAIIVDKEIR